MFLTVAEFVDRVGPVEADNVAGDGPRTARRLDETKISGAIAQAGDLINGYIRARYPAPIDPVPEILKGFAVDIALYRLRLKTGDMSGVTEQVKARYDDAMRQLRDIQAGRLAIDANQPGAANRPAEETPVLVAGEPSRAGRVLDGYLDGAVDGRRW
ncbi:MAG: DUF1320 domain-containing protein [Hyphomicrobiales bacterium]|nr:DUF1320 domain-containing protein [Hyphomicrobiales bacterium]